MEAKIEEKNSSISNHTENNNNLIENSNKKTPEKRKRRGKKDLEGRQFICDYCKKAYLSKPALNSHLNSKHKEELIKNNIQKKIAEDQENFLLQTEKIMNMKNKILFLFLIKKIEKIIIIFYLILIIFVIMFLMKLKNI